MRGLVVARLHWLQWRAFGAALPEVAAEALAWAQTEADAQLRRGLPWSAPLPRDPATARWLIARLEEGDALTRRAAAARLADAAPLLRAAADPDHEVRWAALAALAKQGEARALPAFERELATGPLRGPAHHAAMLAMYHHLTRQTGGRA